MYCLGVFCLLSAAVALPTSEPLRTNLPGQALPPELKSEEKDNISDEQVLVDPIPSLLDAPESEGGSMDQDPTESTETLKAEKDEDKDKLADVINEIQKESKESKEPWESKEFEERPKQEQPNEEKIETNSKYEESKEGDEEDRPIIVQILQKPPQKDSMPTQNNYTFEPSKLFSYIYNLLFPNSGNGDQQDQPIIVREANFAFVDRN